MKIGSNNIFAEQSRIFCHSIENGKIKLKPLTIGNNCLISCWGSIQGGVECGNQVELKPGAIPLPWLPFVQFFLIVVQGNTQKWNYLDRHASKSPEVTNITKSKL